MNVTSAVQKPIDTLSMKSITSFTNYPNFISDENHNESFARLIPIT